MPANNATIQHQDGGRKYITKAEAFRLLETGEYRQLSRHPLIIQFDSSRSYRDELRHLSGYLLNKSDEPSQAELRRLIKETSGPTETRALCQKLREALKARRSADRRWKGRKGAPKRRTRRPRRAYAK